MLTPAQRLFFNINGYILLEQVFTGAECATFLRTAEAMKSKSRYPRMDSPEQSVLFGPAWFDRVVLKACMDPRLRAPAEEVLGGRGRLEENEFLITFAGEHRPETPLRWHRGLRPDFGSFQSRDDYHCLFVKAIIYLTDLEPGQETLVVPGSHKLLAPVADLVPMLNASLIRGISARPGDVLLFGETLIHSSPATAPSHDRALLVIAYCAPFMQTWSADTDPPDALDFELSDEERKFVYGLDRYAFPGR